MNARPRWVIVACALATAAVGGCVPLFVPPVPAELVAAPAWRVSGDGELTLLRHADGRPTALRLQLRLEEAAGGAYLAVQWYGPAGGERASESTWVTADDIGRSLVWLTPADLKLEPGRWRAVVSVGDRLLRQFDVEVASDQP